jgi:hypothetical protein
MLPQIMLTGPPDPPVSAFPTEVTASAV